MKSFESFHPIILFVYFLSMIVITMFTMNPIILGISFSGSIAFAYMLVGRKELLKSLAYSLPLMVLMALTNPLFVHRGETILFYLNENPITLESVLYGVAVSFMIIAVFYWFKCYNAVMTSDKFIYLFGRTVPKISLLLSMIINFVPKFKRRFREIDEAQKAMGIYATEKYIDKIKNKMRVLSILVTWSLENSIDIADSMNSRGYALKGRTSYSVFKITLRDIIMGIFVFGNAFVSFVLLFMGKGDFEFYPTISGFLFNFQSVLLYIFILILSFCAFISEVKEDILWHYLKSKI